MYKYIYIYVCVCERECVSVMYYIYEWVYRCIDVFTYL